MIGSSTLRKKGFEVMLRAHAGQMYGDEPYYNHTMAVGNLAMLSGYNEITVTTALCHDVFEDSDITPRELYDLGFPLSAIWGIWCMTYKGKNTLLKIAKARICPISHVDKDFDAETNYNKCVETNDPGQALYAEYRRLLAPGMPTPADVERYCGDFELSSDQIAEMINQFHAQISESDGQAAKALAIRKKELVVVGHHQINALKLVSGLQLGSFRAQ